MPFQEKRETETRFIPARVTDNRWNNPEYVRVLENLTGWQKRAWLDGDWDIAAGQYFTTLRREVHVVEDFDDSRAVEWFAALDYGFAHYTVVLLGCRDGDGNIFIVDEHAERLWLPQRHAAAVKAMLARHKIGERKMSVEDLKRFVAGADVFSRQSDGTTIAAQYSRLGIYAALREHRPRERLGGNFAAVRRCRGAVREADTFHSQAMRSPAGNFAGVAT